MMRTGARSLLRSAARSSPFAPAQAITSRRFLTTQPAHLRSRSWKSSALRWGVAIAGVYYYTTSPVFAEQPQHNLLNPNIDALEDESPTLDALTASSRRKSQRDASVLQSTIEKASIEDAVSGDDRASSHPSIGAESNAHIAVESPEALEEEAAGEAAFNPITGEINWDCPCLGGMAYGPCGPQFREAFSCFVYSTEEMKGMDCIDKFQAMQNCFREHPEVYKGEIEDDEELDAELAQEREQLAQEIAERKKAVDEQTMSQGTGRLLEEPVRIEKASKPKQNKKGKESKSVSPQSDSTTQPDSKTAPSSEPQPGMSAEHEALHEGAPSPITQNPRTRPIDPSSVVEDELIPQAAHDAVHARPTAK